jgi:hypothetical protein
MTQNSTDNAAGSLTVDNLLLDGNTISTTNTNGDLVLAPDGSGVISITTAAIVPSGDRADSLGSTSNAWDTVYLDGLTFNDGTDVMGGYVKTSFTPTLDYSGGISTPLTYGTQTGYYWRIGKEVYINFVVVLTNKGVGSGNVRCDGSFPQNENNTVWCMAATMAANTALRDTGTQFRALYRSNDNGNFRFYSTGNGNFIFQQVGQITNTTEIRFSGMYRAKSLS